MAADLNDNQSLFLKPGMQIKPINPLGIVEKLVSSLYGMQVQNYVELNSYDDRNYHVFVQPTFSNPHIPEICSSGYVLKILNSKDSTKMEYVEAIHSLMDYLREKGISTPKLIPNIHGKGMTLEKIHEDLTNPASDHGMYIVRLQEYIPGVILGKVPYTPKLFYNAGKYAGHMDATLQDFHHSFYDTYKTIWSLTSVPKLVEFAFAVTDNENRKLVDLVCEAFSNEVVPCLHKLQKGMIHGDFNEQNILVEKVTDTGDEPEYAVCGVIDFSDASFSCPVFELSLLITYLMIECKNYDPLDVGGHTMAGYFTEFQLNETERDLMKILVCGRLVQSLVMGAYTHSFDPTNDYLILTAVNGWPLLHKLWKISKDDLYRRWNIIVSSYK